VQDLADALEAAFDEAQALFAAAQADAKPQPAAPKTVKPARKAAAAKRRVKPKPRKAA
jgi:hypothetical protein